jgi:predicted nucleotide-binding protein (sugar kinase/HSP70/actin superfamily)
MLKNGAKFAIKTAFAAGPATVAAYSIYKNRKTTPYYKVNGKVYKWTKPFVDKSYEAARTVVDRW